MDMLRNKVNEIFALPYKDRFEPSNIIYNALLVIGYKDGEAKQLLRQSGLSRGLISRLQNHTHLLY